MIPTLGEDGLDPRFLAERFELADEFDFDAGFRSQPFGIGAEFFAQRFGPLV